MHHILLPSPLRAPLSSRVIPKAAPLRKPHAKTRGETGEGDGGDGGRGGGSYLLMLPFFRSPTPDGFIAGQKKKEVLVVRGAQPILAIPLLMQCLGFFLFCFFVIRTSPLHYASEVHGEYHRLPAVGSMRMFWPPSEPAACKMQRELLRARDFFCHAANMEIVTSEDSVRCCGSNWS